MLSSFKKQQFENHLFGEKPLYDWENGLQN